MVCYRTANTSDFNHHVVCICSQSALSHETNHAKITLHIFSIIVANLCEN